MPDVSLSGIEFEIKGSSDAASDSIKKLISSLGSLKKSLESSAKVSTLTKSLGYMRRDVEKTSSALSKIGGLVKSLGGKMGKILSGGTKGFLGLLSFPLKGAVKNVGAFAKSLGDVGNKFKRILGYRIIRSLIKEIEQAFGEGIKNLYGWSKAMGGATISGKNFAQTMDGLATSSLYFKNSIGAMVAPIISALAPAIDYIIDKVVALINVINQLFALLGGATSWNKATRKATEFEEAAGGAGGAAKEALRYLAPFDELNRLPDDNKGGGGGGAAEDWSDAFEEVEEFQSGFKDFVESIKTAISEGDWQGLGTLIGGKVNELIDSIDFAGIGSKVGEGINSWFTTKYWTLQTINFTNIGSKIAEFLNNALEKIDFDTIGRSFAQNFTILPDIIIGFLADTDWELVGKSVGDYLRGALDHFAEWIDGINWSQVGMDIVNAIGGALDGLDIGSLIGSILNLIRSGVSGALELLTGVAKALFVGGEIESDVTFEINPLFEPKTGTSGTTYATTIDWFWCEVLGYPTNDELKEKGKSAVQWIADGISDAADEISYAFTGMSWDEFGDWIENGSILLNGWLSDIPAKAKNAGIKFINSLVEPIVNGLNSFIEDHPDIADYLGLKPINFQLIPEIPQEELTKNYDEAKRIVEENSKSHPVGVEVGLIPKPNEDGELFDLELNPVKVPLIPKPNANGEVFTTEELLGGKSELEIPAIAEINEYNKNADGSIKGLSKLWSYAKVYYNWFSSNSDGSIKGIGSPWSYVKAYFNWFSQNGDGSIKGLGLLWSYARAYFNWVNTNGDGSVKGLGTLWSYAKAYFNWVNTNSDGSVKGLGVLWSYAKAYFNSVATKSDGSVSGINPWSYLSAIINAYTIADALKDDGKLLVRSKINIVGQSNTPTISAKLKATAVEQAKGGAYYGGSWHSIPQYASGGKVHGSMFIAGEAGPEIVGHVGGRTEVLNQSQLAATMYAAVSSAMNGLRIAVSAPSASAYDSDNGMDEETMYRAFSRALADSDLGGDIELDGETLYRSVVRRNRQNTRATGVNQLAMA